MKAPYLLCDSDVSFPKGSVSCNRKIDRLHLSSAYHDALIIYIDAGTAKQYRAVACDDETIKWHVRSRIGNLCPFPLQASSVEMYIGNIRDIVQINSRPEFGWILCIADLHDQEAKR